MKRIMSVYYYAYSYAGGSNPPVTLYRFAKRSERDAWVSEGMGRLPTPSSKKLRSHNWHSEEVYLRGVSVPIDGACCAIPGDLTMPEPIAD